MGEDDAYGGLLGAIPYAGRASDSWLFRSYVLVGTALAALTALLFTFALVGVFAATATAAGGTFTFVRSFVLLVGVLVVVPLVWPILSVARRHRRGGSTRSFDARMALAGYGFVLALYLGLVISTPPAQQSVPDGPLAGVVAALYGLPRVTGPLLPAVLAGVVFLLHRRGERAGKVATERDD